MSFDLFLHHFKNGEVAPADRNSFLRVLRRYTDRNADQFGFYLVSFADGSAVELSTRELESDRDFSDCAFHLRNFSPLVIKFVYAIATAGNMVIINAQGDGSDDSPQVLICHEDQRQHLPEGLDENPLLVESALSLGMAIGLDIGAWQAYRDHVVSGYQHES